MRRLDYVAVGDGGAAKLKAQKVQRRVARFKSLKEESPKNECLPDVGCGSIATTVSAVATEERSFFLVDGLGETGGSNRRF